MIVSQGLCCSICLSLNFQAHAQVFTKNISQWMRPFQRYISPITGDCSPSLDDIHAALCEIVNLYVERYYAEISEFLGDFSRQICLLLGDSKDQLATAAIKLLTTMSRKGSPCFARIRKWNKGKSA